MSSFLPEFLERQPITTQLLSTCRAIGEFKGKQQMFAQQSPERLEQLRLVAEIQSTESSNRIEGVIAPRKRIEELVAQKTTPQNRSEQEIAGYRDVLATIHANASRLYFTPGIVQQFHRDLYQFLPGEGGHWKMTDNTIQETHPDGSVRVRFTPVPAFLTPMAMQDLHQNFNRRWDDESFEPLLLIPAYVLDFLCVHPFRDGNGRMARLLTLLLLYRAGYEVGRYISLERLFEQSKESYYDTLYQSSQGWHSGKHSLLPWWEYFTGVILASYKDFEDRVGIVTTGRGVKREQVLEMISRLPSRFKVGEIIIACPGVSQPTIRRVLDDLREAGQVRCIQKGKDAEWEKLDTFSGRI
jgi:Fic family protein